MAARAYRFPGRVFVRSMPFAYHWPSRPHRPTAACGRHAGAVLCRAARGASFAATDAMTTDATFRYRTFDWQTSNGKVLEYRYIVAQQPDIGGETAKRDALSALEAALPPPVSGWSFLLIPSVSLVCGGKEEVRPLAALLTQAGHRCYIAEWPGWTGDAQCNWALAQCKLEHLSAEYQDFWCQLLEHVASGEPQAEGDCSDEPSATKHQAPRVCVVGAGFGAIYALRGIAALQTWRGEARGPQAGSEGCSGRVVGAGDEALLVSFAMLAPSWHTVREGFATRFSAVDASWHLGGWLHSDSRLGRLVQSFHFSRRQFRKHFAHAGLPQAGHAAETASWLFQRYRPYIQTDGAVMNGLLDPLGAPTADSLAEEVASCSRHFDGDLMLLAPRAASQSVALSAALQGREGVQVVALEGASPLPHEVAPSMVHAALEAWLPR